MTIDGYPAAVGFALVAAIGAAPAWAALAPAVGGVAAFGAYLLVASVLFVAFLAPGPVVASRVGLVAGGMGLVAAWVSRQPWELAICAGLIVGIGRWTLCQWGPFWARLALEACLMSMAILMVPLFVTEWSPVRVGMAIWGFFLVEGLYFLFERWLLSFEPPPREATPGEARP